MSVSRLTRQRSTAPHVCDSCGLSFVNPEFGVPLGDRWLVHLHCMSCGWFRELIIDEARLEEFERELDEERDQIQLDLERLTEHNMREYRDRFVAALAADAILPEDF
jgi:hypothetical protein